MLLESLYLLNKRKGYKMTKNTIIRKITSLIIVSMILYNGAVLTIYGDDGGEMGISGGISEGSNLPFTMDKYVESGVKPEETFEYKEVVFLSGKPVWFSGTVTVKKDAVDMDKKPSGTYKESYVVEATNVETESTLNRSISFITSYRLKEEEFSKQIVRNSIINSWNETITVNGRTFTLDEEASSFSKASVEDITPGVSYYDTVISYNAEYEAEEESIVVNANGNIYGYSQPWSKVETQNIEMTVEADEYGLSVRLKPFSEAKKTMYFDETEPFPISFGGTYNQRLEREATLTYEIMNDIKGLSEKDKKGSQIITTAKVVEKLPIPNNLDFLQGHWAEDDIKKLYSMEILTETPKPYMQFQAMSRGEFIKALCLTMDIDTSKYEEVDEKSKQIFNDVAPEHPLYKYIMAAYDAKLVKGVGDRFNIAVPITREEAFVIYIRVIGLERLGITNNPVTPFVDDQLISTWAKKEIMAGYKLGIIKGNNKGEAMPKQWITKAESAAIINRLIDYLREEIAIDYRN